jgi:hypothetical protein
MVARKQSRRRVTMCGRREDVSACSGRSRLRRANLRRSSWTSKAIADQKQNASRSCVRIYRSRGGSCSRDNELRRNRSDDCTCADEASRKGTSAYPGKVDAGFPKWICANARVQSAFDSIGTERALSIDPSLNTSRFKIAHSGPLQFQGV